MCMCGWFSLPPTTGSNFQRCINTQNNTSSPRWDQTPTSFRQIWFLIHVFIYFIFQNKSTEGSFAVVIKLLLTGTDWAADALRWLCSFWYDTQIAAPSFFISALSSFIHFLELDCLISWEVYSTPLHSGSINNKVRWLLLGYCRRMNCLRTSILMNITYFNITTFLISSPRW